MKRIILSLIITCLAWSGLAAQDLYDDYNTPKQEQVSKKERKEKEKRLKAANDSADFKFACAALRKGHFVLMATRVELGNMGAMEYGLDDHTNFVYQVANEGVAQIALNNGMMGLNGFGGVTCQGNVSGTKFSTDKKGNALYEYNINGTGLTVRVNITVYAGTKQAIAYVEPILGSSWSSITLHGELIPYNK
ncbi:MAG: DUF4251 domain-containing protein [Muribaculaceae bacterium]|nr:DUF4251 domain-containing protein [Muribaculaceae bacterium]